MQLFLLTVDESAPEARVNTVLKMGSTLEVHIELAVYCRTSCSMVLDEPICVIVRY